MLFDQFTTIAEHLLKEEYFHIAKDSMLFKIDKPPHIILPKKIPKFNLGKFQLPSPTVAIEDPANLVILCDLHKNAKGLSVRRKFIDVEQLNKDDSAYSQYQIKEAGRLQEYEKLDRMISNSDWGKIAITEGIVNEVTVTADKKFALDIEFNKRYLIMPDKQQIENIPINQVDTFVLRLIGGHALTAIEELLLLYRKGFISIKKSPKVHGIQMSESKSDGKIPRSSERPIYVIKKKKKKF